MPVFFYIDPEFVEDPALKGVDTIYLSYTFFEAKDGLQLPLPGYTQPYSASKVVAWAVAELLWSQVSQSFVWHFTFKGNSMSVVSPVIRNLSFSQVYHWLHWNILSWFWGTCACDLIFVGPLCIASKLHVYTWLLVNSGKHIWKFEFMRTGE